VRALSGQEATAAVRTTIAYRLFPRLTVGVSYNAGSDSVSPIVNFVALTETSKRPALILTASGDRIGTPYGRSYAATFSKDLSELTGLPIAPYAGVAYGTYEDKARPVGGVNIGLTSWMTSTVLFDGRKVHPMLNFHYDRHGFVFLMTEGKHPGVNYSVSF
jgi:hypothetical protein